MMKKFFFLIVILAAACLHWAAAAAPEDGVPWIVNIDEETKGDWLGQYGGSGSVIYWGQAAAASGRDPEQPKHIENLPEGVGVFSESRGFGYSVVGNPSEDKRALWMPAGNIRKAITSYAYDELRFKVTVAERKIISFYMCDFSANVIQRTIEIINRSGKVCDTRTVSTNDGIWISVMADEEFTFRAVPYGGGATSVNLQAVMIDEYKPGMISAAKAEDLGGRSVKVSWENPSGAAVNLYRKSTQESIYTCVTSLGKGASAYTDRDLEPGVQYDYMVCEMAGKIPAAGIDARVRTEAYGESCLTVRNGAVHTLDKPGGEIAVKVAVADGEGKPMAGRTVVFTLEGENTGLFIPSDLGTKITNSYGEAILKYDCAYAGDFEIVCTLLPDDENKRTGGVQRVGLRIQCETWKEPPALLHVSDEISPGEVFSVNGQGMVGDVQVALYPADGAAQLEPPREAVLAQVIQQDATQYGYYVSGVMPLELEGGAYDLWVKNAYGWSKPIRINAPRPLFITENEINEGSQIYLVGRNFDPAKFGAQGSPSIRLNDGQGNIYPAVITEATRVSIKISVSKVPRGKYFVEVNNGPKNNWARLESGQTLRVVEDGEDPLGLGVAWAKDFVWDVEFNAADYGAKAGDNQEDTAAIQTAVDACEAAGGGIVRIPAGEYLISEIRLGHKVVLMGEGREVTRLKYVGPKNGGVLTSNQNAQDKGFVGVANLTLWNDTLENDPSMWYYIGHQWGSYVYDKFNRTCANIFLYGCGLKTPYESSGNGVYMVAKEKVLIKNNVMDGGCGLVNGAYVTYYMNIVGNEFTYATGALHNCAEFSTIIGNTYTGKPEYARDMHGISARGNIFVYDNIGTGCGTMEHQHNDGEFLMLEPPGLVFDYGTTLKASQDTITIVPTNLNYMADGQLQLPEYRIQRIAIMITAGRGMGQTRFIVGTRDTSTVILEKPWDIVPDATSEWTMVTPFMNATVYKNTGGNTGGTLLFYGNGYDCVSLENELDYMVGIFSACFFVPNAYRLSPNYYIRVEDCVLTNSYSHEQYTKESICTGMGAFAINRGTSVQGYGIEYKNNATTAYDKRARAYNFTTLQGDGDGSIMPYMMNVTMTGNRAEGFLVGLELGQGVSGVILQDNDLANNDRVMEDTGADNVTDLTGQTFTVAGTAEKLTRGGQGEVYGSALAEYTDISQAQVRTNEGTASRGFGDISDDHWCRDMIYDLVRQGIVSGKSQTAFAPEDDITRAEFIALTVRAARLDSVGYKGIFKDVAADDWYADAVQTAYTNNLIDDALALDGKIFPQQPITREEMASVLIRAYMRAEKIKAYTQECDYFVDFAEVSPYAKKYVATGCEKGFFSGDENRMFMPKNPLTRAEAAAAIHSYLGNAGYISIMAVNFAEQSGVEIKDGFLASCDAGDWIRFDGIQFDGKLQGVLADVAVTAAWGGTIYFYLDSMDGDPFASLRVNATGDWTTFLTQAGEVHNGNISGTHSVYLKFSAEGTCNLKAIKFQIQ